MWTRPPEVAGSRAGNGHKNGQDVFFARKSKQLQQQVAETESAEQEI
jgi:hypothetical protein